MSIQDVEKLATILGGLTGVFGLLGAAYRYLGIKSRTEKMTLVGTAFRSVVTSLASEKEVDRLAGAVLLRRFFDPLSEYGLKDLPYADESVNVIAAMLRMEKTGVLQKLLADGLAHAPTLEKADLQGANLEGAYLGDRAREPVNLSRADLYRAILRGASLKGVRAAETIFYEADLSRAVLTHMDLRGADFRAATLVEVKFAESDLAGAKFDGAKLQGARFKGARNIPDELRKQLDADETYVG